ncbi:MAG: response regulator [Pseudomonadales bacterium]|nr:response regulator [Pseudomonadales bacterium]
MPKALFLIIKPYLIKVYCCVFLCFAVLNVSGAVAQRLQITPVQPQYALGPHIEYLEDVSDVMHIQDVLTGRNLPWQKNTVQELNLGYSSSRYWLRIAIDSEFEQNWLLSIDYPLLDDIKVFLVKDLEVVKMYEAGDRRPYEQRPILHPQFLFPLHMSSSDDIEIYVSVRSTSALILKLKLWQKSAFIGQDDKERLKNSMLYGAMLLLSVFAFLMGASLRNRSYLFFSGFAFLMFLSSFHQQGYPFAYIWPENIWWQNAGLHLSSALSSIFFSLFIIEYLGLRKQSLYWYRFFIGLSFIFATLGILSAFIERSLIVPIFLMSQLFMCVGVLIVSAYLSFHGHKLAKYLLYSNAVLAGAFVFWLATAFGLSDKGQGALIIMQFALLIMFLVLSYALALGLRRDNEQAQAMKDSFMSTITHELLTPINGIALSLSLLKDQMHDAGMQYWEMAQNSNRDLLSLVQSMIVFTEAQTGKLSLDNERFNLPALLKNASKNFHLESQSRLKFEVEIADDLPIWVVSDKRKINLIIKQLLKNAFAFTKKGQISLTASMRLLNHDQGLLSIVIKDNGFGIDRELQDIIFDAFNQGDSSITREHGGLGIGLTNVKDILSLMGGKLELNSQLGLGSEFMVTIPLTIEPADATAPAAHDVQADTDNTASPMTQLIPAKKNSKPFEKKAVNNQKPRPVHHGKILVVEDNPVNMTLMLKLLEIAGFKALAAEHGERALAILRQEPDIVAVLMDCQMPVMDGFEATREIRKMQGKENLPIIAVTANVSAEDKKRCFEAGMNDYLAKPASREGIQAALDKWLNLA